MDKWLARALELFRYFWFIVLMLGYSLPAHAREGLSNPPFSLLLGAGLTCCGDEIDAIIFTEESFGTDRKVKEVDAGSILHMYGGFVWRVPSQAYGARVTIGLQYDGIRGVDDEVSFTRYPLEIIPNLQSSNHRFGIGVTRHILPEYDVSDLRGKDLNFNDVTGIVFEYGYQWLHGISFDMRYVDIEYETTNADEVNRADPLAANVFKNSYDGSYYGVYVSMSIN